MEKQDLVTLRKNQSDAETGLVIKGSFIATSGFKHLTGMRDFGDLKIVEGVSKGTSCLFLSSLMVLDQNGALIFDADVKRLTNYSREMVRQLVLGGLMNMLREAADKKGLYFDELAAWDIIDQKLKNAYYLQSYEAVIDWAKSIGIEI